MKKMILTLMLTLSPFSMVLASTENLLDTGEAVNATIETFRGEYGPDIVMKFKGLKASPGKHGVSVKLYLTEGSPITYGCHRHEDNEPFECHETN